MEHVKYLEKRVHNVHHSQGQALRCWCHCLMLCQWCIIPVATTPLIFFVECKAIHIT